ncbi:MAG: hypothetical protein AAGK98_12450 [Pseudomonadota bacterium]
MQVDPLFQQTKRKAEERRKRQRAQRRVRLIGTLVGLGVLAIVAALVVWIGGAGDTEADLDVGLAQVETELPAEIPNAVAAFVDIAGDPMILRLDTDGSGTRAEVSGPDDPALSPFGPPNAERFSVLRERLAAPGQQVATNVPSSRADLALFQAYRRGALTLAEEGSGDTLEQDLDTRSASVSHLVPAALRSAPQREQVVQLRSAQPLATLLSTLDLEAEAATRIAAEIAGELPIVDPLPAGSVIALRTERREALLQLTAYGPDGYLGSVARTEAGLRPSADPWIDQAGIAAAVREAEQASAPQTTRTIRLLDAIYSAALRGGLPSAAVGELSVMMARLHDLDRPAGVQDRLDLVLAPTRPGARQIAYAGISTAEGRLDCYVVPREDGDGFRCHDPATSGGGVAASQAVLKLVDQIIRVESAGDPNAKNTRSTATGLGQFINKTWLRMIRTYRPDLMEALSQEEVLALRTNPQLSRQMVVHLAQENEDYLRDRQHEITPGRLYLAHFLGPVDAHRLLGAEDESPLMDVLNARILEANPYIADYSVKDLEDWADRKMRPRRNAPTTPLPEADTEALKAYRAAIDAVMAQAGG